MQLSWWPVARDSSYYCLTVLVLIYVSFDGRISTWESAFMLVLYVGYIVLMQFNERLHQLTVATLERYGLPEPGPPKAQPGDYRSCQGRRRRSPCMT